MKVVSTEPVTTEVVFRDSGVVRVDAVSDEKVTPVPLEVTVDV